MLAAQPLSQALVPWTVVMELLQVAVVQVLAAQPLSQALVPCTVVMELLQVAVVQVLAAQPLLTGGGVTVPQTYLEPFQHCALLYVQEAQPLSIGVSAMQL